MKIYDLKKLEKCFVCGNIDRNMDRFINMVTSSLSNYTKVEHPKEIERQERLRSKPNQSLFRPRYDYDDGGRVTLNKKMKTSFFGDNTYNNSAIIVSGNSGIGNKSMKYYQETFTKLDEILANNNCFIFFVRGNNDDPSMFNEEKINFEHIKAVPDYSVILLKNFNCLCIGGSVSLDKEWKLSQEKNFGKKLFWEGEEPYFDEDSLDEILSKYKIGCVISSTSPSFVFPGTNSFNKSKWFKEDTSIKSLFSKERKTLDKVYDKIIDSDTKPYAWFYGRFKQNNQAKVNDIIFDSLFPFQIESITTLIAKNFGIDTSKKFGDNIFALDSFFAEEEQRHTMPRFHPHNDAGEPFNENEEELEDLDGEFEEDGGENDNGVTVENARLENPWRATNYIPNNTITAEDLQRATQELEAATRQFNHAAEINHNVTATEMRFEMPQYTITNGRVELIHI